MKIITNFIPIKLKLSSDPVLQIRLYLLSKMHLIFLSSFHFSVCPSKMVSNTQGRGALRQDCQGWEEVAEATPDLMSVLRLALTLMF